LPPPPPTGDDWTVETALDLDMASAACPKCRILVIEADDDTSDGLIVANDIAAQLGATVVSDSWGAPEQPGTQGYEPYLDHPGVAVFVSAGDGGYDDGGLGADYPATSAHVIAVGGTRLERATTARGWIEMAWSSGGSACSQLIAKPHYQSAAPCTRRATADLAAVGDPQTGVAVSHGGAWSVVGGTSAATPLVAAIFAATGNGARASGEFVADHASALWDVTDGSNGACGNALCDAGPGWDGPTGYGTPNMRALADANDAIARSGGELVGGCSAGGAGHIGIVAAFVQLLQRRRARSGRSP
jgi:hypothetical protein